MVRCRQQQLERRLELCSFDTASGHPGCRISGCGDRRPKWPRHSHRIGGGQRPAKRRQHQLQLQQQQPAGNYGRCHQRRHRPGTAASRPGAVLQSGGQHPGIRAGGEYRSHFADDPGRQRQHLRGRYLDGAGDKLRRAHRLGHRGADAGGQSKPRLPRRTGDPGAFSQKDH